MIQFVQANGKVVLAVVGLELRERPLELTLPIPEFTKYRLDNPPLFGHFADHLPKRLLAAPDVVEPIPHIDGFAPAQLQGCGGIATCDIELDDAHGRRKRLPLETGVAGVTVECSLSIVPDGYFTPKHRHNFDQIRYTLSGLQSTGLGDLAGGECGYFPEGSHYGPQQQKGEC